MNIGQFGETFFEVSDMKILTFNNLKQDSAAKFAEHDVIGQVSKLEYLKREPEKLSFEIKLISDLGVDVEEEIFKLRQMCQNGIADFFIIGGEVSEFEWIIESLSVEQKIFNADGTLRVAEIKLTLKEYN